MFIEAADIILGSPLFKRLEHLDLAQRLSQVDRDRIAAVLGDRFVA